MCMCVCTYLLLRVRGCVCAPVRVYVHFLIVILLVTRGSMMILLNTSSIYLHKTSPDCASTCYTFTQIRICYYDARYIYKEIICMQLRYMPNLVLRC